jgi:oligopeptide transport system ATP-binding protein
MDKNILLEVTNLQTSFYSHLGEIQAVRGVSFQLEKGKVLGIVGESGSGKSVSALSVMRLIQEPGEVKKGSVINFLGKDLTKLSNNAMMNIRGNDISMIFQDPMTSLNPVYTIENQMIEVIRRHQKLSKQKARERAIEMLRLVGIPQPEKRIKNFPHQFSGGMRQRVMIATALSCNPQLLIADEPTTALDVTIQAQILELMKDLKDRISTSIIIITHDLGVIAEVCDNIVVMYGGTIMETGTEREIFYNPQNPYTMGLHQSIPKMNADQKERLVPIKGSPPDLLHPPTGCPFAGRCPHAMQVCIEERPPTFSISETHTSACWLLHEDAPEVGNYTTAEVVGE